MEYFHRDARAENREIKTMRKIILLLVFLVMINVVNAQQDSCLTASEDLSEEQLNQLISEAATRIWNTYSQISKYTGNNNAILRAALQGLDNWEPEPQHAVLGDHKEGIKNELRKIAARGLGTGNIYLCLPEANIPIPFCSRTIEGCERAVLWTYENMDACKAQLKNELKEGGYLYEPGKDSEPRCVDKDGLLLAIFDSNNNIHKPKLIDFNIQVYSSIEPCQAAIERDRYFVCQPTSADGLPFCTQNEQDCSYGKLYSVIGEGRCNQFQESLSRFVSIFENYRFLCKTPNNIYYIPLPLQFGTRECRSGDTTLTRILGVDSLNPESYVNIIAPLNQGNALLCGSKGLKVCLGLDNLFIFFKELEKCTIISDEETCENEVTKLTNLYNYQICYDYPKNDFYCTSRENSCNDRGYIVSWGLDNAYTAEECESELSRLKKEPYQIQCIDRDSDEYLCKRDTENCSPNLFGLVYRNLEECRAGFNEHATYLCQINDIWLCDDACKSDPNKRAFNGGEQCIRERIRLNNGYIVSYYDDFKKYYDCGSTDYILNVIAKNQIERTFFSSKDECLAHSTLINSEQLNINWYLCNGNLDGDTPPLCSQSMLDCPRDRMFPILGGYTTESECNSANTPEGWLLCESDGDYECQREDIGCQNVMKRSRDYWSCIEKKEELQPTEDQSLDVIFIPVSWRGDLGNYEFYVQSQYNYFLKTLDISTIVSRESIKSLNLNTIILRDKCEIPDVEGQDIDEKVLDCIWNNAHLREIGFIFNPAKDKIIALTDQDMGGMLGFTSHNFPYLNIVKFEDIGTLAHELGHSAFNLCDEYLYEEWDRQNGIRDCPNKYPLCCLDNPENTAQTGNHCYPATIPSDATKEIVLCAGNPCLTVNEEYCRSMMGRGYALENRNRFYKNSLEHKYILDMEVAS